MIINALFLWISVALLFLILEVGHPGLFFFLSFSLSSLFCALLAFFDVAIAWQCTAFLIVSCIAFELLSRFAKRLHDNHVRTNVYALEGKKGQVLEPIRPPATGLVKVEGEVWTARSLSGEAINSGVAVLVVHVRGAHLVVKEIE